jgi:hypothetical protein
MVDPLEVATRAYAVPLGRDGKPLVQAGRSTRRRRQRDSTQRPPFLLALHCATTVDTSQRLLFGCYRFFALGWATTAPTLSCLEEGMFHPDQLAEEQPEALGELNTYVETHAAAVASRQLRGHESRPDLRLHTRSELIRQVLLEALAQGAVVVAFNAPFELSRVAVAAGLTDTSGYEGGFSLTLDHYQDAAGESREDRFVPRLLVRAIDANRARLKLTGSRPGGASIPAAARSAFLDLRTLSYALTGEPSTLDSACDSFAVPCRKTGATHGTIGRELIDQCRDRLAATANLYRALAVEYQRWQLELSPTRAYSPASLAKAYLRQARVVPPLDRQPDFPAGVIGEAMAAYYGGRSECRIRRTPVPITYLDFASMYPTVCTLTGLWPLLRARQINAVDDDPAEAERWLNELEPDNVLDQALWPRLCGLALVEPRGEVLPVRARYSRGGSYGIGSNPLTSQPPLWYTLPDLLAARLIGGSTPHVLRVIRLVPQGTLKSLQPIRIRGSRLIDARSEDLFKALVEERRRHEKKGDPSSLRTAAALKVVANSASYGIFVELNRQEPTAKPQPVRVYTGEEFDSETPAAENPGAYFFPPLAALASGGARLMLALLERLLTDVGGLWAFADTDSAAAVSTQDGGLIPCLGGPFRDSRGRESVRALSWEQLDQIIDRFAALNPYDPALVPGSILELEDENLGFDKERRELHCFAISAKRYALYTVDARGAPQLVKSSQHALGGFYLNPIDPDQDDREWTRQAWQGILHPELGLDAADPAWLDRPALSRFTANSPRLLRGFSAMNKGKPYPGQVKPFNLLLIAHTAPGGHPAGVDPKHFTLAAAYDRQPASSESPLFFNIHKPTEPAYRITPSTPLRARGAPLPPGTAGVETYRTVLDRYRVNPEPKSLGPDHRPCRRDTIGLLSRRPIRAGRVVAIGKETNLLDEVQAGLIGDDKQTLTEYQDLRHDTWTEIEWPALRLLPDRSLAKESGLPLRTVQYARGGRKPRPAHRHALTHAAAKLAREELRASGTIPAGTDLACLTDYIEYRRGQPTHCEGCGKELTGRQRRWCASCRQSGWHRAST